MSASSVPSRASKSLVYLRYEHKGGSGVKISVSCADIPGKGYNRIDTMEEPGQVIDRIAGLVRQKHGLKFDDSGVEDYSNFIYYAPLDQREHRAQGRHTLHSRLFTVYSEFVKANRARRKEMMA